jgi:hypothetical protein
MIYKVVRSINAYQAHNFLQGEMSDAISCAIMMYANSRTKISITPHHAFLLIFL